MVEVLAQKALVAWVAYNCGLSVGEDNVSTSPAIQGILQGVHEVGTVAGQVNVTLVNRFPVCIQAQDVALVHYRIARRITVSVMRRVDYGHNCGLVGIPVDDLPRLFNSRVVSVVLNVARCFRHQLAERVWLAC